MRAAKNFKVFHMNGDGLRTCAPVKSIKTSQQVFIGFKNLPIGYYRKLKTCGQSMCSNGRLAIETSIKNLNLYKLTYRGLQQGFKFLNTSCMIQAASASSGAAVCKKKTLTRLSNQLFSFSSDKDRRTDSLQPDQTKKTQRSPAGNQTQDLAKSSRTL